MTTIIDIFIFMISFAIGEVLKYALIVVAFLALGLLVQGILKINSKLRGKTI